MSLIGVLEETDEMAARDNTYCPPIANGPTDHTPRIASGTYFQWEDLGWVQPRHGQPCRSENGGEQEHEEDRGAAHARGASTAGFGVDGSASEATGAEHTDTLTD